MEEEEEKKKREEDATLVLIQFLVPLAFLFKLEAAGDDDGEESSNRDNSSR